jgi:hypothetical protein
VRFLDPIVDRGGSKEPQEAFSGQRDAQLRDPERTVINLYAPLPAVVEPMRTAAARLDLDSSARAIG